MLKYISSVGQKGIIFTKSVGILIAIAIGIGQCSQNAFAAADSSTATRIVNVPYLGSAPPPPSFTPAIFWFGKVGPTSNYADVRMYYYDQYLGVVVHVIDRRLYYDTTPTASDLTNWDAISLYLNADGNVGETPGSNAYRFDGQFNNREPGTGWQTAYKGNGSTWSLSSIPFTTDSFWRGDFPNNTGDDRGWSITFQIPFSSLGLSNRPNDGTIWGLGVILHDRDDAAGTPIQPEVWPETMNANQPSSWGQLRYGFPQYKAPISVPEGITTIRNGLNGAVVTDAEVGGHTTCGEGLWPDIWNNFGNANYSGYQQINIQNQWDISDFACFSKYYVTFPLDSLPKNRVILSAKLTMYEFSCAANSKPSYIQTFIVNQDWQTNTISWNNAPLAQENISGTWVDPEDTWVLFQWDVSRAVAQAYAAGEPLRLALYSADGDYSSGKYFWSSYSETGDIGRPTLSVQWGSACEPSGGGCDISSVYIPLTIR